MTPPAGTREHYIASERPRTLGGSRHRACRGENRTAHRGAALTNLPLELSSLVRREKDLAEVKRLLADTRLLTRTGSGGCGKTRLALAAVDLLGYQTQRMKFGNPSY